MKLKVMTEDIKTGNTNIAILNEVDAKKLDLFAGDRIIIKGKKNSLLCIADIAYSIRIVPDSYILLYDEAVEKLNVQDNSEVTIEIAEKPASLNIIKKKLSGKALNRLEYRMIVEDIVNSRFTDIEFTYFVAACSAHNLSLREVKYLISAIVGTGTIIKPKSKIVVDKHCVGGVAGNRTTSIVVPIVAAAGYTFPKTSSRAITSPAGTADTMECLTNVSLSKKRINQVLKEVNACMVWGGALNLAPADDKIIRIEHPLSIDVNGLLLSSVMSKKKSVSATHLLIDIPWGIGSKIEDKTKAEGLKSYFETVAKALKIKIKVVLTDGRSPIGNGIGPLLESKDVIQVLKNESDAPQDLKEKGIRLAGEIFELVGTSKKGQGHLLARNILENGQAWKKMQQIIKAQGQPLQKIGPAKFKEYIHGTKSGIIKKIDNSFISKIAKIAGAPNSKAAGVYIHFSVGNKIKKDNIILTIHSNSKNKLEYAKKFCLKYLHKNICV